jgi:hypothetical protein
MHINKIYFILSHITIHRQVLVASVAIIMVSYKNINNIKIMHKMYN